MDYIYCPSGMKIPHIGFGTYTLTDEEAEKLIPLAYRHGYRLFDCAPYYKNQAAIGRAIRRHNLPREQLFLSSKVPPDERGYCQAGESINRSLSELGVRQLDLLLLHSPCPLDKLDEDHSPYYESNREMYQAMEEAFYSHRAKYLGVSNFNAQDLADLLSNCRVKPAVNQIKLHPHHVDRETLEYCKGKGILIEAYSPLGSGGLLLDPMLNQIAQSHRVSPANICLSFVRQIGCLPITMAREERYMDDNISANTMLSPDELYCLLQ